MTYALIRNGSVVRYPYSFGQLRDENPQVSFPRQPTDTLLATFEVLPVSPTARPEPSDRLTKNVVEVTPTLVAGKWVQTWGEVAAPAKDAQARRAAEADDTHKASVKADAFVGQFVGMTAEQIETYVNNHTANLVEVRALLVQMGKMLAVLARREFR